MLEVTEEKRAQVLALRQQGVSLRKIAARLDMPHSTVALWLESMPEAQAIGLQEIKAKRIGLRYADLAEDILEDLEEIDRSRLSFRDKLALAVTANVGAGIYTDKDIAYTKLKQDRQSDAGTVAIRMRELDLLEGLASGRLKLPSPEDVHIIEGESREVNE